MHMPCPSENCKSPQIPNPKIGGAWTWSNRNWKWHVQLLSKTLPVMTWCMATAKTMMFRAFLGYQMAKMRSFLMVIVLDGKENASCVFKFEIPNKIPWKQWWIEVNWMNSKLMVKAFRPSNFWDTRLFVTLPIPSKHLKGWGRKKRMVEIVNWGNSRGKRISKPSPSYDKPYWVKRRTVSR